jgi:peptide/nickel transport system substrate-binding protein
MQMTGRKKIVALAAAAAAAITLAACGGGGAGAPPLTQEQLAAQTGYNPQPYENIKDGGTLTLALPEISAQFNTFQGDGTAYTLRVWRWYNPILFTFTADGDAVANPDYLSDVKYEVVGGNSRITYTINPKAAYNDGSPIDWTSFEATWKTNNGADPAYSASSTDGYDRIASITKGADDRQAIVTFNGTWVWWQGLFNFLLNPKAATPDAYNKAYIDQPHPEWGAGPYTVKSYDKQNGALIFERNPKWWGKPGKLDTFTYLQLESTASINAFRNGQTDAVAINTKDEFAQLKGQPGTEIRKGPSLQLDFYTLNGASPILSDPKVRKAVLQSIDRRQIAAFHFNGLDYTADPVGSMLLLPFQKGYTDVVDKVIPFNPEQAKKDLDAAGWVSGPDGIRAKNGQRLQLTYVNTGNSTLGKALSGGTQAMLKPIGIDIQIRDIPSSDYSKAITSGDFDIFYSGVSQSDPFALAYLCQTYCSNSQLIRSKVNDPKNDALIKSVGALPTAEEQYAKAPAAEEAALATYGVLPTVNLPAIQAVKVGLANAGAVRFFTTTPENIGWQK